MSVFFNTTFINQYVKKQFLIQLELFYKKPTLIAMLLMIDNYVIR